MESKDLILSEITENVIGCAYRVSNTLGCGFLEKIYEKAMVLEIRKIGLKVKTQFPMTVRYDNEIIGEYVADLFVEDVLLVELKSVEALNKIHFAQCLNYLKATGLKTCLLINFGRTKVQIKRFNNYFEKKEQETAESIGTLIKMDKL